RERDAPRDVVGLTSATATLIGPSVPPTPPVRVELDETVIGEASTMAALASASLDERRRTVLPRRTRAEAGIQKLLSGHVPIRCHITLGKRTAHATMHWIDRHPGMYTLLFWLFVLSTLGGVAYALVRAAHAIF